MLRDGIKPLLERLLGEADASTDPRLVVVSAGLTDVINELMLRFVGPSLWDTRLPAPPAATGSGDEIPAPRVLVHSNRGVYYGCVSR